MGTLLSLVPFPRCPYHAFSSGKIFRSRGHQSPAFDPNHFGALPVFANLRGEAND